jgi:phosphoribosylanthranilate isomerase
MRDRRLAAEHARALLSGARAGRPRSGGDPAAPAAPVAVKLCGLTRPRDVEAANAAAPDMAGFVVDVPSSRRSVGFEALVDLLAALDPRVAAVGVFVDEPPELVGLAVAAGVDVVQLHGHEDDAYLRRLRETLPAGVPVIQGFLVAGPDDVERADASAADLVLLDGGRGQGRPFDWGLLTGVTRPYVLAGGLGPDNVALALRAAARAGARPWGVDMSSGVETDGAKDPTKMAAAVAAAKGAER